MNTLFIGQKIIAPEQTDSTNSHLLRMLEKEELFEGTVVITNKQKSGRGQRGATWESEEDKNLTFSILLYPIFISPAEQFILNKAVSLGVVEFVYSCLASPIPPNSHWDGEGLRKDVRIKWPNDIYVGDKKIAGILIENIVLGNHLQRAVVGIGININQEKFSSQIPNPTSLKMITGKEFNLEKCFWQLCSCIEKRYLQLKSNHIEKIDADYRDLLYRLGMWSFFRYKGEMLKARITGITKNGKLILETEKKEVLECDFKEVNFC